MAVPALKVPGPHGRTDAWERYRCGQLDKDGFAATFFRTLLEGEEKIDIQYSYRHSFGEGYDLSNANRQMEAACKEVNKEFNILDMRLNAVLQQYLLEHDGVVDLWPEPCGRAAFSLGETIFRFHFFGNEYEPRSGGLAGRKKPEYLCEPVGTDVEKGWVGKAEIQKHKLGDKAYDLKKKASAEKRRCRLWVVLGGCLLLVGLLVLANLLFGLPEPVTGLLALISRALRGQGLSVELFPILRIAILVLCALGLLESFGACSLYRKARGAAAKAAREYKDYCDGQYARDLAQDEAGKQAAIEEKRQRLAFYNQWRKAWFDWARWVGDIPGSAG